ncbi:phaJ [Scenedesmus sp. PABB004]|nr:phaJ [Scenedesmus sp. PABB004]
MLRAAAALARRRSCRAPAGAAAPAPGAQRRALHVGQAWSTTRAFSAADAAGFGALTGDANPIHADRAAAAAAGLAAPVVPGMLLASLFPALIGTAFPGALYLGQSLKFRRPAPLGAAVTATVTVSRASGGRVAFATVVRDAAGAVLVDGDALARVPAHAPALGGDGGGGGGGGGAAAAGACSADGRRRQAPTAAARAGKAAAAAATLASGGDR